MGGGRNSILIFVIKRWLDFQGYEMGGEQLLLRYPNNTGSPGSQPLAAASVPGKKKQPEGWAHLCLFIYLFDQRESRLYFSQSSICLCVCVFFFLWLEYIYATTDSLVDVFVCFLFSKFVCLFVYMFEVTECWIPRVYALVGQLVFVGVDETNSKFLSTRTNFALPFDAFCSRDLKQSMSKLSGPVNGDECYFWRTTGCYFADKCRFRHVPESKGVDLKRVEAKYGGKLRVTTPPSQWKKKQK